MKMTHKAQGLEKFVQAIMEGQIEAGQVIRQSDLCEVLGMSMSPLRDLLALLDELDLIEAKPRAGFKITYPDLEFMRDNMQFRMMIETEAVGVFVEEVSNDWIDDQITRHKDAIAKLEMAENPTKLNAFILDFDRAFHRTIVDALKNREISKAHEHIQTKLRIARQVHRRVPPRKTNTTAMQDHLAILGALKTRDNDAVQASLDKHFTTSMRNTLVGY